MRLHRALRGALDHRQQLLPRAPILYRAPDESVSSSETTTVSTSGQRLRKESTARAPAVTSGRDIDHDDVACPRYEVANAIIAPRDTNREVASVEEKAKHSHEPHVVRERERESARRGLVAHGQALPWRQRITVAAAFRLPNGRRSPPLSIGRSVCVLDEPVLVCPAGRLGPVREPELAIDLVQVELDGRLAQPQLPADRLVREAARDGLQDLRRFSVSPASLSTASVSGSSGRAT